MFFEGLDLPAKKRAVLKAPPIPETGWRPPADFPNLSAATLIGFDCETKENDFEHGPGWARGNKGHIVGFSIAAIDRIGNRGQWYFPVRHEVEPGHNLDARNAFGFARDILETKTPKVGANLIYDCGWLTEENINVGGELHDIQFAEALLHDRGRVNLEHLSQKYIGQGKVTNDLYEWCAQAYGGEPNDNQRENIWRASPRLVGPYAEADASHPIDILKKQWPSLEREGMLDLYRMECDMIMLYVKMRIAGVSINLPYVEKLYDDLKTDVHKLYESLFAKTGIWLEKVNSANEIAKVFESVGLSYPKTEAGNPSFQKEWLKEQEHPVADLINNIRELEKIRSTFIRSYMLEKHNNGKLHCSYHPLRGDAGGTITGRLSSSDPNLQNIPVRTAVGKKIRRAFIADAGHAQIEKNDHSQIEYRMLANFAVDKGDGSADRLRAEYNDNPSTDYHDRVMKMYCDASGKNFEAMSKEERGIIRRPLKNINFGLIYGQTQKSLAYKANMKSEEVEPFFKNYFEAAPYIKPTMQAIGLEVQTMGYITTMLGRRVRFDAWEPAGFGEYGQPLPYVQAIRKYGTNIRRAYAYRGTNYKFQGSAADALKYGMWSAMKAGVFDVIGVPRLQVHDELVFSVIDESPAMIEAHNEMRRHLESVNRFMRVPTRVDFKRGDNWGDCE